jgi:endonuclease-8
MPEGHTLRRLADDLGGAFAGRQVRVSSPQGRFATEAAQLDGTTLVEADSAGKHLFLEFDGDRIVHIHLGLIGGFDVRTQVESVPPPRGAVRLRIVAADEERASYADLRGATRCDLVTGTRRDEVVAGLGPDPLRADADPDAAWQRIRRSSRTIGDLLMDQSVLAGVGNVYRAEVLFRQRIHPLRPGRTLRVGQWQAIWDDLVVLMAQGVIDNRIDTVRPEHTPEAMGREPRVDDHGGEVYVYRRAGMPCHVCGADVRTEALAGRNSFWCPRCQPPFRSRAVQSSTTTTGPHRGPR